MILTQTKAVFIDAYRELNAKKLFWITMALNVLVVALFAALGINQQGVTLLHWTFDSPFFNADNVSPELFYKLQFTSWGIPFWLSWVTTILALISTAGIVPDLVSGGMIEPVLSKPIGRVRLFLTKYITGLFFVALQVLVFTVGCILVIGIRGNAWEPKLLLAVPIVLAFFSYLFAFCAFLGLITRSTITSLLGTLLLWFLIFLLNIADSTMLAQREGSELRVEDRTQDVERQENFARKRIDQLRANGDPVPGDNPEDNVDDPLVAVNPALGMSRNRLAEAQESAETWRGWARNAFIAKTVFPKTQETISLLERELITREEILKLMGMQEPPPSANDEDLPAMADPRTTERVTMVLRERSTLWILGTSFGFEAFFLALCCLIFARRDF
jgi:ABC-type transport system involved in multi-copper enzyme maturation permease subunit